LTSYTGPSTISTANTVISGKIMGCVRVTAPGVVIRNSKILCERPGTYVVDSSDGAYSGTPLLVEDSEVACTTRGVGTSGPGTAFGEANITVRRTSIYGCENGFDVNQRITIEDSYIHDMYNGPGDPHTDGIQMAASHLENGSWVRGAKDVVIRHNTIYGMGDDGSFGTSAIISNPGGDTNILIEHNLMAGGAYTLYCEGGSRGTNYRVLNNRFSRRFGSKVGTYGPSTDCSDEVQSGNVYHETGEPLNLS
jgi:hypothetical protein